MLEHLDIFFTKLDRIRFVLLFIKSYLGLFTCKIFKLVLKELVLGDLGVTFHSNSSNPIEQVVLVCSAIIVALPRGMHSVLDLSFLSPS